MRHPTEPPPPADGYRWRVSTPLTCPSCGADVPGGFAFCGRCGAALAPGYGWRSAGSSRCCSATWSGSRHGRTGPTPRTSGALLRPYHARLRREIERFGGTLDKFIGDAVMARVRGAAAHEDDPERAVRCAAGARGHRRAERDAARPGPVGTDRRHHRRGARGPPARRGHRGGGRRRRQHRLSPAGGGAGGRRPGRRGTWRATQALVRVRASWHRSGSRARPSRVPVWRLVGARGRFGVDVDQRPAAPFIGRDAELDRLERRYARPCGDVRCGWSPSRRARGRQEPADPGVRALRRRPPELVTWRQGRCLPYGDGITFWALGEIVKAQAGILESDPPAHGGEPSWTPRCRHSSARPRSASGSGRGWRRCSGWAMPRAQAPTRPSSSPPGDASSRRWPPTGPLVLVVEDLHWADAGLLAVPQLPGRVVGRRRPAGDRRGTARAARPAARVGRTAEPNGQLGRPVTARRHRHRPRSSPPCSVSRCCRPRCRRCCWSRHGGNPLYAEEFCRLLSDRGLLERAWPHAPALHRPGDPVPRDHPGARSRPGSIPCRRSARRSSRTPRWWARSFWSGALAAISGRDEPALQAELDELERKELIRPASVSSVAGQTEYAFWHAVVRDVAYAQIPRADGCAATRQLAEWLERLAGERLADRAELIAHHYSRPLPWPRRPAAGDGRRAQGTRPPLPGPGRRPDHRPRRRQGRRTTSAPWRCWTATCPSGPRSWRRPRRPPGRRAGPSRPRSC